MENETNEVVSETEERFKKLTIKYDTFLLIFSSVLFLAGFMAGYIFGTPVYDSVYSLTPSKTEFNFTVMFAVWVADVPFTFLMLVLIDILKELRKSNMK